MNGSRSRKYKPKIENHGFSLTFALHGWDSILIGMGQERRIYDFGVWSLWFSPRIHSLRFAVGSEVYGLGLPKISGLNI